MTITKAHLAGLELASARIQEMIRDYDHEFGSTDPDTGQREHTRAGEEYLGYLDEIIEDLSGLIAQAQAAPVAEPVAVANRGKCAFWVKWTDAAAGLYGPGIKLYAEPPPAAAPAPGADAELVEKDHE